MDKSKIGFITILTLMITVTFGAVLFTLAQQSNSDSEIVTSQGTIEGVNIALFIDESLTTTLTSVAWGTLEPDETATYDFWVYNDGYNPVTLSLVTSNWNPIEAEDFIHLTWNYNNQVINKNEKLGLTFTLNVDSNIEDITNFGFQITVTGTG